VLKRICLALFQHMNHKKVSVSYFTETGHLL
jgi:hypothetical protein